MTDLPKFDLPPVVEVVLSVQFAPLAKLSAAHCGWYWRDCLGDDWSEVSQTTILRDVFEKFGEDRTWSTPGIQVSPASAKLRLQFINDDHMIQLQDSRFVLNWRKRADEYPSFDELLPKFEKHLEEFMHFVDSKGLGDIEPNQWEVTYVNHVVQGSEWNTSADWGEAISKFLTSPSRVDGQEFDSVQAEWSFIIGRSVGRLHVQASTLQRNNEGRDIVSLHFTARGPVDAERNLRSGLVIGHEHVVRAFTDMTTEQAHAAWKRKQ